MSRQTTTGATLEQMVIPALTRNGYLLSEAGKPGRYRIGLKPNGRHHDADIVVRTPGGLQIIISMKWQQSSGTAEEKVPYEVIKLLYVLERSKTYARTYIVLGGGGWTLRDWFTSKQIYKYIPDAKDRVHIVTFERFIELANKKKL